MKVKFSFGSGHHQVSETIEFDDDNYTDKELDELLSDWLWDRSNAHWVKEEND